MDLDNIIVPDDISVQSNEERLVMYMITLILTEARLLEMLVL